jgi:hypothetical protein
VKVREILHNFIYNLSDFLSAEAVVDSGIKVVFATEPQKTLDGYVAYGAVSLLDRLYDFEVRYDKNEKTVEISSPIFWFRRKIKEIRKFLEEINKS